MSSSVVRWVRAVRAPPSSVVRWVRAGGAPPSSVVRWARAGRAPLRSSPLLAAVLWALAPWASAQPDGEWQRYVERAAELRRNLDRAGYDEAAMLKVLRQAGVFETVAGGRPRSFYQGFRPFRVRVYSGLWRWPLRAGVVSSEYGRRWGRRHEGIDISADEGVPVLAAAPGTVLYAGDGLKGYGLCVILRHDQNTTSLYAHNQRLLVKDGDSVSAGRQVALLGSTGQSTGPHVHFELRRQGRPIDPRTLLVRGRF